MKGQRREDFLTRERILVIILVMATALTAWLCWRMVEPFVPALTWAVVLAVIAHPLHERILARLRWPGVAAALALVIVTVVIALPTALLVREVSHEAAASADAFHRLVDGERWKRALDKIEWLAPVREYIDRELDSKGQLAQGGGGVSKGLQGVLTGGVEFAITLLVTFFLLFFFLRDKWRILATVEGLMPLAPVEAAEVVRKLRDMISAVVYGTLVVALVQGMLGGLMFWWLGLPAPLMWGACMALMAVLPLLGAGFIWVPAAAMLALDGNWEKALILTAWGAIVIGLVDNILLPILLRNRLHMHTVPVFIAAVGGLFAFGATGIVLGPLILALGFALLEVWKHRIARHEIVGGVNDNAPWNETGT
jgi:predicted PurR-regulated permease PerM